MSGEIKELNRAVIRMVIYKKETISAHHEFVYCELIIREHVNSELINYKLVNYEFVHCECIKHRLVQYRINCVLVDCVLLKVPQPRLSQDKISPYIFREGEYGFFFIYSVNEVGSTIAQALKNEELWELSHIRIYCFNNCYELLIVVVYETWILDTLTYYSI